jgi:hypothetical protein
MRKIFDERTRLVVYLEHAEVVRMTAEAREQGCTLVEWAREALRNELQIRTNPVNVPLEGLRPKIRRTQRELKGPLDPTKLELVFAQAMEDGSTRMEWQVETEVMPTESAHKPGSSEMAGGAPSLPNRKTSACKHGRPKGYNCWQCGGTAVIE